MNYYDIYGLAYYLSLTFDQIGLIMLFLLKVTFSVMLKKKVSFKIIQIITFFIVFFSA